MSKKNSAPTVKDVAFEAGVSLGTVSKVINGKPVGEEYVKRVNEAIAKLDYHVNSYAQGLKASKTRTVAVIIPNTSLSYFGTVVNYINMALMKRDYRMLLCCSSFDYKSEQAYIHMAKQNKVDGIIGLTYNPELNIGEDIPYVSIDRVIGTHVPCVACDNFMGGQMAAEKLIALGCKRMAFMRIGSPLQNEPNKRRAGFENGCMMHGIPYTIESLDDGASLDEFAAFIDDHIHDHVFDYDGLFCVTDRIACLIRKMLTERGIRVPEDVQIIGFDGLQQFEYDGYFCSTIVQPVQDIAELCVDLLLQPKTGVRPQLVCLPPKYAPGGTTKEDFKLY